MLIKSLAVFLEITIIFSPTKCLGDEDIRCIETSCDDVECSSLPKNCNLKLNKGLFMLSPDICNCCDYCLAELEKGDACTVGDHSNGKHQELCGSGLMCKTDGTKIDGTCQEMETSCTIAQQTYDKKKKEGFVGSMETIRPICDYDGNYASYKCIPGQICYCLHQNGSRIFGEANYNTVSNYMPCDCSRKYYDAVEILGRELYPHEHFRCTSNGNYEQLQCINDECLCVNSDDGVPANSNKDLVNFENITSKELPCFTGKTPSEDYYKECEKEFMEIYQEVQELKESGYQMLYGYQYPKCDLDGTYQALQENKTHKYCVDKNGYVLTALNKTDTTVSSLLDNMDCKCVRANLIATTAEKPQCLENGNYNFVQCRRGICRCVDNNGDQVCTSTQECEEVDELNVSKLPCYKF